MELPLLNNKNKIIIDDSVFNCDFNESLVHQVLMSYISYGHKGTKSQKSRSEVRGSNKKPWRQKGTGRARAGSIRSPIWRSGGVAFAAKPQKNIQKVNKKMYNGALKCIFSELVRQNRLILVKDFYIKEPKTKMLIEKTKVISSEKILIIVYEIDNNLILSSRNLHKIKVQNVFNINLINLVSFNKIIITIDAVKHIENTLK